MPSCSHGPVSMSIVGSCKGGPRVSANLPPRMANDTTTELPPRYEAADVQKEVEQVWEDERLFHAEPTDAGEPFSVVIPPPNVTAKLHLGHAFNNTIQDILVRQARMQGKNAVWIPGTDHAGIATQTVVDKRLQMEGQKSLKDYKIDEAEGKGGREAFTAKVQAWKDEYEQVILGQLKAMGCSCDYERTAFTMDEPRSKAVREAFFRLFKDGLIYRGKRLVNWDPATQTALADDEVENEEIDGHFYYLKYPLRAPTVREGSAVEDPDPSLTVGARDETSFVIVATTRPETMLGDTAVAINPKDPRAEALRGMKVVLPIVGREIPIVEDDYVVMPGDEDDPKAKFATGFLKVTPAHDPNDWDIGQRHDLEVINIMAPDASISERPRLDAGDGGGQAVRRPVSRGSPRADRRMVQGQRPAREGRAVPPQRRPQLPQPRAGRAVSERPVVHRGSEADPVDGGFWRGRGHRGSDEQSGGTRAHRVDRKRQNAREPRP